MLEPTSSTALLRLPFSPRKSQGLFCNGRKEDSIELILLDILSAYLQLRVCCPGICSSTFPVHRGNRVLEFKVSDLSSKYTLRSFRGPFLFRKSPFTIARSTHEKDSCILTHLSRNFGFPLPRASFLVSKQGVARRCKPQAPVPHC